MACYLEAKPESGFIWKPYKQKLDINHLVIKDMEIRSIKVNFVKGEIKAISLNAQLDLVYQRLFQNSRKSAQRKPLDVDHGIKVIIFGCFWLEALCNNHFREVLKLESKNREFGIAIWKKLKRSNFFDKLEIISTLSSSDQRDKYNKLLPSLKRVFDLRNRLAHFKDEDDKLTDSVTLEDALDVIISLPVPEINQELMWAKVGEYAEILTQTGKWLKYAYKSVSRRHGIIVSNKGSIQISSDGT